MKKNIWISLIFILVANAVFGQTRISAGRREVIYKESIESVCKIECIRFNNEDTWRMSASSYEKNGQIMSTYRQPLTEHNLETWVFCRYNTWYVGCASESIGVVDVIECRDSSEAVCIASKIIMAQMIQFTNNRVQKMFPYGQFKQKDTDKEIVLYKITSTCITNLGIEAPVDGEPCTYRIRRISDKSANRFAVADYYLNHNFVICSCNPMENWVSIVLEGAHTEIDAYPCEYERIDYFDAIKVNNARYFKYGK